MKMTAKTRAIRKTASLVFRFAKSNGLLGFGIAIMLSLTIAAPATAGHIYVCDLRANSEYGWIPSKLEFFFNEKTAEAMVYDGYIDKVYGKPIAAEFLRRNPNSIQLNWDVKGIPLSNRNRKMSAAYSAIFNTATGRMSMTVYLRGADGNPPKGSGKCRKKTN
jgi:hypothetical protein